MCEVKEEQMSSDITKYRLLNGGQQLSFGKVLDSWINNADSRKCYNDILKNCSYRGFFWEHPPLVKDQLDKPYEFVLVETDAFDNKKADLGPFAQYFEEDKLVVAFPNQRNDGQLVVPCPIRNRENYLHLTAFVRNAPEDQVDAFLQLVGRTFKSELNEQKTWLSTSGLGVYWLHVRVNSEPRYYQHMEYRDM